MKIVIVDDEQFIVDGLIKIISRQYPGDSLHGFTDPQEALCALEKSLPDLMITDIRMPGMSGLELISALKEQGMKHYAILTGLNDVPILQESIRLRVEDYLIKPVSKPELFSLIDRIRAEISTETEKEQSSLSDHFLSGDLPDAEVIRQLLSQLRRSECPPIRLNCFLADTGRELPFW